MGKVTSLKCPHCGGACKAKRIATGTLPGVACLLLGLVGLALFWPVGCVFILVGLIYAGKAENVWVCSGCRSKIPRA